MLTVLVRDTRQTVTVRVSSYGVLDLFSGALSCILKFSLATQSPADRSTTR